MSLFHGLILYNIVVMSHSDMLAVHMKKSTFFVLCNARLPQGLEGHCEGNHRKIATYRVLKS